MAKSTTKAAVRKVEGGMKVKAGVRGFTIVSDEPAESGGTDAGSRLAWTVHLSHGKRRMHGKAIFQLAKIPSPTGIASDPAFCIRLGA